MEIMVESESKYIGFYFYRNELQMGSYAGYT